MHKFIFSLKKKKKIPKLPSSAICNCFLSLVLPNYQTNSNKQIVSFRPRKQVISKLIFLCIMQAQISGPNGKIGAPQTKLAEVSCGKIFCCKLNGNKNTKLSKLLSFKIERKVQQNRLLTFTAWDIIQRFYCFLLSNNALFEDENQ